MQAQPAPSPWATFPGISVSVKHNGNLISVPYYAD